MCLEMTPRPLWLGTLLAACYGGFLAASTAEGGQQAAVDYLIGPHDALTVQVFDQPDLGGSYVVEADGTFSFPLIGRVTAGGLTIRAFEAALKTQLADGYFTNPQVTVAIEQYRSQRLFVMGEVRNPGPVSLSGDMTLIEALARAGSMLPSASGRIAIVRGSPGSSARIPPPGGNESESDIVYTTLSDLEGGSRSQQIELHDGDTIFVVRAESAYVFGEVKAPGAYIVQGSTTILQALSLAGGVTEDGAMNRIRIIRLTNGEKRELKPKLSDDVLPGDTIVVPRKYF
jgi:polysaccharide export outer membrane protein